MATMTPRRTIPLPPGPHALTTRAARALALRVEVNARREGERAGWAAVRLATILGVAVGDIEHEPLGIGILLTYAEAGERIHLFADLDEAHAERLRWMRACGICRCLVPGDQIRDLADVGAQLDARADRRAAPEATASGWHGDPYCLLV